MNNLSENEFNLEDIDIASYVLNENNIKITQKFINGLFKKYDTKYKVKNLPEFQKAMTHTSYIEINLENEKNPERKYGYIKEGEIEQITQAQAKKCISLQQYSYERLEFLGDSIIRTILAEYLFKRYANEDEGFMTRLRTKIEKGESLAKLSLILGLNKYILMSKYLEYKNGREKNISILEDVFEAFMGALFCESNYETCKSFLVNVIEKEIDIAELLNHNDNYKDTLLQYYHKMKWDAPIYTTISEGNDLKKEFTIIVKDNNGKIIGTGSGTSKKKGQQVAAYQALISLGVITEESDSETEFEHEYVLDNTINDNSSDTQCDYVLSDSD